MKSRVYIRVGILFLATLVIAFWGLNYLKGKSFFTTETSYFAKYDRIGGLTKSSPVTINGFQIGQVRKILLSEKYPGQIEVRFSISYKSIDIPIGSIARIYSVDLMGTKGIALDLSNNSELCLPEDTLTGSIEGDLRDQVNAQMLPFKIKAESLMSSMDSVLTGIQLVFSESNRKNLAESFSSVNLTLNNLEFASQFLNDYVKIESKKISNVLSKADTLAQELMEQTDELKTFIANMRKFSDTLAAVPLIETFVSFRKTLDHLDLITKKVSAGEGSLGKLVVSDSLYFALLATNASLNRLIEDIRLHPGSYVRVSLSDKSKSVYPFNDTELARELAGEGVSDYYICLLQSPTLLTPDDPALAGFSDVRFIQIGAIHYYYIYSNRRIEPCLNRLEKIRKKIPTAGIFTWVGGKWQRLSI